MITEAIINLFLVIPKLLIGLLPKTNLTFPNGLTEVSAQLLYGVGYVLPVAGLLPILICNYTLMCVKIVWAFAIRVKSFIPTMGS